MGIVSPVTVEIDIPVTRRTKIHSVIDGDGVEVFHARKISDVFDHLIAHEVSNFTILDDDASYCLVLTASPSPNSNPKG